MNYKEFPKDVNAGERILLDDGKLIFEVTKTDKNTEVEAVVVQGGPLKSKKGVNLPNTKVSLPALTEKDIRDAKFAIENDVDWIALSFVRTPKDLEDLQDLIAEHSDHKIPIIAERIPFRSGNPARNSLRITSSYPRIWGIISSETRTTISQSYSISFMFALHA